MGKKWENFQKFSFSFKKEKAKKKRPSLLSFEEYTLTHSLAHYYAFFCIRAVLFADTRRRTTLTCRERERKKKDG